MRLPLLLALTVLESFSVILLERGVYFYTSEALGFSGRANLALALVFGLAYAAGAQSSHPICRRVPERMLLTACLLSQTFVHGMLTLSPCGGWLWAGMAAVGFLNGLKWPLLESFISAGKTHAAQAKAVGAFNLAWSIPVPLSLGVTGWLVAFHPSSMFALAMLLNLAGLPLLMGFPARPDHTAPTTSDAFAESLRPRWTSLLRASRWSMLSGYVLLFLLSPLLPGIFRDLGLSVALATPLAAVLDVCRVLTFLALRTWTGWHGRLGALFAAWIGLPLGLALCVAGPSVPVVVLGQILFGLALGLSYYASFYYAMALHRGSVEAGGDHEALIGGGFAIGPALGLLGLGALGMNGVLAGGLVLASLAVAAGRPFPKKPKWIGAAMKLISWNVNGIRAVLGKGFADFVESQCPDVLCLQETKARPEQVPYLWPADYKVFWNSAKKTGYSGTCVATHIVPLDVRYGIGIEDHDQEGRVISVELPDCWVVTVYTPNSQDELRRLDYRSQQWDVAFLTYVKGLEASKPVVFCGDLNVAHREIDLANPQSNRRSPGFTDEERLGFDKIVGAGFVDSFRALHPDLPQQYTWWSYRTNARARNVGWRIDYVCLSQSLRPKLREAFILPDVHGSDHCPVGVVLS